MIKQDTQPEKDDVGYWLISNEVCTSGQTKEKIRITLHLSSCLVELNLKIFFDLSTGEQAK